jgi:hypothetical protein
MRMHVERWMMAPLAGLAIAAGLLAWIRTGGDEQQAPARSLPPAMRPAAPVARAAPQAAAPMPNQDLPLNAQVERLLATRDPADALRAYWLIANCAGFNTGHGARLCGSLTERERQARLDYLAIALKAGVPGAATAFVAEGPFGDPSALQTRPDDPLVKEWKAAARAQLARAADSGTDFGALNAWATDNDIGSDITEKNPAAAYPYMLAIGLIQADLLGPDDLLAKVYAQDSDLMTALAAGLSPEQRAAGLAAARHIAGRAKEARERARGERP